MNDLMGHTIAGRYRADAFLGRGGMAEVYKVWDHVRSVILAMKVLNADLAEDKVFLRRFRREAETLSRLQHPHIVRSYGLEQDGRLVFILMDFVDGTSLRSEIFDTNIPFSIQRVIEIMRPVCAALQYAHSKGFIHCDVKPANIMIDRTGRVLVSDFGIARMTEAATATMVGAGTPAYMAPEQAHGEDPSTRTDIYALGVVLFEMLTGGERPFTGEHARTTGSTGDKIRWEQIHLPPPSLRKLNSSISPEMEAVVMKCLAKKPEDRYQTIGEFIFALERLAPGAGILSQANATFHQPGSGGKYAIPFSAQVGTKGEKTGDAQEPIQPSWKPDSPITTPQPKEAVPSLMKIPPSSGFPSRDEPINNLAKTKRKFPIWAIIVMVLVVITGITIMLSPILKPTFPSQPVPTNTSQAVIPIVLPTTTEPPTPSATQSPAPTVTQPPTATEQPVPSATQPPAYDIGSTWTRPADGMVMVYVPEGSFSMGSNNYSGEQPVHSVDLDAYWIDKTEVTNAMYAKCVQTGACPQPQQTDSSTRTSYFGAAQFDKYPVIYVTWFMAGIYCKWVGARLPTEAEWEKAARGTDGRAYPWGNASPTCELANFWDTSKNGCITDTSPVGSYPSSASPYVALDMAGNVMEWIADWLDPGYYAKSLPSNPTGPISGTNRVLRGGAWGYVNTFVSSSYRFGHLPQSTDPNIGFRCSRGTSP